MKFYFYNHLFIGTVQYKKECNLPKTRIFTVQKEYDYYILTSVDQTSIKDGFVCYLTKEGIDHKDIASINHVHSLSEMTQKENRISATKLIQVSGYLRKYYWVSYGVGDEIKLIKRQRNK